MKLMKLNREKNRSNQTNEDKNRIKKEWKQRQKHIRENFLKEGMKKFMQQKYRLNMYVLSSTNIERIEQSLSSCLPPTKIQALAVPYQAIPLLF